MENEVWKDIKGYEGLYQVSSLGRVKSLSRVVVKSNGRNNSVKGRILKSYSCRGYRYVDICKNGIYKKCKIHRLVAEAFLPNPDNLPQVNHKDETLDNNKVENLEWCTPKYNINYGTAKERMRDSHIKQNGHKIAMYDFSGRLIKIYTCTKDVELDGLDRRAVDRVCKGIVYKHKGYRFSYV